jgi:chaperonin cofactor prefoldin
MKTKEELLSQMKELKDKIEVSIENRMNIMETQISKNKENIKTIQNEINSRRA